MKKRKYKFTAKSESGRGIASIAIGLLSFSLTAGMVVLAYMQGGQADRFVAIPGFLALLLSLLGSFNGIKGIMEEDAYHLLPGLGFLLNGMVLAAYAFIYWIGW